MSSKMSRKGAQRGRDRALSASDVETGTRLAALFRLVAFAQSDAEDQGFEFPAYCLELAAKAILDEIEERGLTLDVDAVSEGTPGKIRLAS